MSKVVRFVSSAIPIGLALIAIVIAFTLSAWITAVKVTGDPQDPVTEIETQCLGKFNNVALAQSQLDQVIADHAVWLGNAALARIQPTPKVSPPYDPVVAHNIEENYAREGYASPMPPSITGESFEYTQDGRADLCGARITGLSFKAADLRYARMMGARIVSSEIAGADLRWSNLEMAGMWQLRQTGSTPGGSFYGANLRGIQIYESDFRNWDFSEAIMRFGNLGNDDFSNASFDSADLSGATMRNVDLDGAAFPKAQFAKLNLNIRSGHLPQVESLRDAKNLTSISSYGGSEATLADLRNKLDAAKLNVPAAEINYALNNERNAYESASRDDRAYAMQGPINWVLFGVPYAYGLRPERLALSGGLVAGIFSLFYAFCISRSPHSRHAIWVFRPKPPELINRDLAKRPVKLTSQNCNPLFLGAWFSILSAFRIGWGQISVGEWIARLLPVNYEFQATGWPRTVAGIQSLVSVYLLALVISKYLV